MLFFVVTTPEEVTHAIAVHGCQLSDNGTITHALEVRLDTAFQLFLQGVAPVIIVCGWRPLKRLDLAQYCEAEVMEQYLNDKYGQHPAFQWLTILKEQDSTSVPENLVFVRDRFYNLQYVVIVVGEKVVPRIQFFSWKIFGSSTTVDCYGCDDGVSNDAIERKLLGDAWCTLKEMDPGDLSYLLLDPGPDGRRRSRWDELRIAHHECPNYKRGFHPGF